MCLILLALNQHPDYPLVIAANRDEFYARSTQALHWWDETPELLAGRDLEGGGTWLGLTRDGRLAAVTNFREGGTRQPVRPSRGNLPLDYLLDRHPDWNRWLATHAVQFNGFNLLFGRWDALHWFSNRSDRDQPLPLTEGIHGLCNHLLDTPWPKVKRGREGMAQILRQPNFRPHDLFELLQEDTPAPHEDLPETGIGQTWEEQLSPIFIRSETYGTRSSTLVLINRRHQVRIIERSWTTRGEHSDRSQQFALAD